MSSPTDTNQASEDELRAEILTEFKQVHRLAPADYTENCTNVVMSIIRNEKLKLLSAVRERVVGEDEVSKARPDKLRQSPPWQRNQLRNDQRIALTAIEGELLGNINGINIETDDSVPSGMVYIKGKE